MPIETSVAPTRIKEQRRHPRAQLNLPVRLRWPTPLGQTTEVAETLDICRGGLLIYRRDPCPIRALLWVTFPFDSTLPLTQPETPARIARVKATPTGGHLVGIEFQAHHSHPNAGSAEEVHPQLARERRRRERVPLALPIRVRPPDSPWPEETMTDDVSDEGLSFCTTRIYTVGETVHVALPSGSLGGRWASAAEMPARIVRVSRLPGAVEQQIALVLLPAEKP